jgi:hypothetical protein
MKPSAISHGNLRRGSHQIWPESLPDKAHAAGCLCATALSICVLPFSAGSIFLAGFVFTLATYFVQAVVRGALETWEEGEF